MGALRGQTQTARVKQSSEYRGGLTVRRNARVRASRVVQATESAERVVRDDEPRPHVLQVERKAGKEPGTREAPSASRIQPVTTVANIGRKMVAQVDDDVARRTSSASLDTATMRRLGGHPRRRT